MRVEFVNPFLVSLIDVMTTMAQIEPKPSKPRLKHGDRAPGAVTGVINMTGESACGSLAISFEKRVIFNIAKRMLNEEYSTINDEVTDLVGEITNMVTGGAKRLLGDKGYSFDMTQPAVMAGDSHRIIHDAPGRSILIEFATDNGCVYVEVCF